MSDDKKREDYTIELGEQKGNGAFDAAPSPRMPAAAPQASQLNSPVVAILAYCGSSILMTTTNKYVLSGLDFNLNFFLLAVQVSSTTEYPMRTCLIRRAECRVYRSHPVMQVRRHHHLQRLQHCRSKEMYVLKSSCCDSTSADSEPP